MLTKAEAIQKEEKVSKLREILKSLASDYETGKKEHMGSTNLLMVAERVYMIRESSCG